MANPSDSPEVLRRFESELALVDILAHQVRRGFGPGLEVEELVSYGREGLLQAARRYEADRGVAFRSFAAIRIRGAIIDGVRQSGRMPRRAYQRLHGVQAGLSVSEGVLEDVSVPPPPGTTRADSERALDDHLAAVATAMAAGLLVSAVRGEDGTVTALAAGEDPEQALGKAELLHAVRDAIQGLPDQEAELVRRHYLEGERFDSVARDLGLSKSWASRLHSRAIRRLTKRLKE